MKQIIAINSNSYHGFTLDDAIMGMKQAGFSTIELTATRGWTEHVLPDMSFRGLLQVRNRLNAEKIEVVGMSGHCNLMDPDRLKDFRENIALAGFFGARHILSSIGEAHLQDQVTDESALQEHLISLIPDLEQEDLLLCLEVHGQNHGSGAAIARIVRELGHPRVKIAYDTANALFYSDVDLLADVAFAADEIAYIHLKDKGGDRKVWDFPALGKGWVPFPDLFKLLEEKNIYVPWSIEIEFTAEGAQNVEEVHQALLDSASYLHSLGYDF